MLIGLFLVSSGVDVQCAIPLFDGFFPDPHGPRITKLLFTLAYWYGLAGLHLHTDDTVDLLDHNTTMLGSRLRLFQRTTCQEYETRELKREAEQRKRRAQKAAADKAKSTASQGKEKEKESGSGKGIGKGKGKGKSKGKDKDKEQGDTQSNESETSGATHSEAARRPKTFSLSTFKLHGLGDYSRYILWVGTSDSYTSRLVSNSAQDSKLLMPALLTSSSYLSFQTETEHPVSKARYERTSGKEVPKSLSRMETRDRSLQSIQNKVIASSGADAALSSRRQKALARKAARLLDNDPAPDDIMARYNIGKTENNAIHIPTFLSRNGADPAVKVCLGHGVVSSNSCIVLGLHAQAA